MTVEKLSLHQRRNFENTEDAINRLRGVLTAIDALSQDTNALSHCAESDAILVLVGISQDLLAVVQRRHAQEWVGLGGHSDILTEAEEAEALGKDAVAADLDLAAKAAQLMADSISRSSSAPA
ncbi:hypothetical protein HCU73_03300 [Roseibacterium sp. KMU-115]|uniref:Uncharacterized protein n=2 Tax=Roseicyclus persicicus TaxID=2650661 RepID=A0A7X6JWE5_9RHOB|nr:hypothetical protein [Roseibacterium persicicum]